MTSLTSLIHLKAIPSSELLVEAKGVEQIFEPRFILLSYQCNALVLFDIKLQAWLY